MIDGWLFGLTSVCALGCGLIAGVLFAFSAFVMKGLTALPSEQGIAAMQAINAAAPNPVFAVALFGTALACVALAVSSLASWNKPAAVYLLVGSCLYLVGVILLTVVYHIPKNDALARVEPQSPDGPRYWSSYVKHWTAWNHVRAVAAVAAAATLIVALRVG
jgi:uncharacterized membrane protein